MKRIGKNILPLLILFSVMMAGGQTVFAAATSVQVTAKLTEHMVEVTGTLQSSESMGASEIGVLIASKNADFNQLSSEDIVYANQYELDQNGTFSFKAELPNADLKEYVLQIGDATGLLYRKLLDGSAISESPSDPDGDDDNTQNLESPNPENPDNGSQGSDSNQGGDSQKPDGSKPDDSGNGSQGSDSNQGGDSQKPDGSKPDDSGNGSQGSDSNQGGDSQKPDGSKPDNTGNGSQGSDSNQGGDSKKTNTSNPNDSGNGSQGSGSNKGNTSNKNTMSVKTGDSQSADLWISLAMVSILVFAAVMQNRKRGGSHHA